MNKKLIYIGLDVDDTQYHGAAFDKETGEIVSFKCRPTLKGLVSQLEKLQKYFEAESIKLCYEASYIGHCLQRDLMQAGYYCDVDRYFKPHFFQIAKYLDQVFFTSESQGGSF